MWWFLFPFSRFLSLTLSLPSPNTIHRARLRHIRLKHREKLRLYNSLISRIFSSLPSVIRSSFMCLYLSVNKPKQIKVKGPYFVSFHFCREILFYFLRRKKSLGYKKVLTTSMTKSSFWVFFYFIFFPFLVAKVDQQDSSGRPEVDFFFLFHPL